MPVYASQQTLFENILNFTFLKFRPMYRNMYADRSGKNSLSPTFHQKQRIH